MTECDCCAHLVEIWIEGETSVGYFEYECGLDIEWTDELCEAVEREECPYFKAPEVPE